MEPDKYWRDQIDRQAKESFESLGRYLPLNENKSSIIQPILENNPINPQTFKIVQKNQESGKMPKYLENSYSKINEHNQIESLNGFEIQSNSAGMSVDDILLGLEKVLVMIRRRLAFDAVALPASTGDENVGARRLPGSAGFMLTAIHSANFAQDFKPYTIGPKLGPNIRN